MNIHAGKLLAAAAVLVSTMSMQTAEAVDLPPDNGPTVKGNICMQKVFMAPSTTVSGSNRLNCTANDIRLSGVKDFSPKTCNRGERFNLTATFVTKVTASSRYDAGFFFRIDGGVNARGDGASASGECSVSALKAPPPANGPVLKLDADAAGDLNSNVNPGHDLTFTIPNVLCEGVIINGKEELKLPNCTSWHNTAANDATISDPFNVSDAFTFKPDTKSKCVCDDNFTVPVVIEDASIEVTKTASTPMVSELGAAVIFTATMSNGSSVASLDITSITDVLLNGSVPPQPISGTTVDLANASLNPDCGPLQPNALSPGPCTPSGQDKVSCPSLKGTTLAAGDSVSCHFAMYISGDTGDVRTDRVTMCGVNPDKPSNAPCDSDDESVAVNNTIGVEPTVVKTAVKAGCEVTVDYSVSITNNSAVDSLTVGTLVDVPFGNIRDPNNQAIVSTTCATIPVIGPGGVESCTFVAKIVDPSCDINHTNTVTVTSEDDDGEDFIKSDTATVDVEAKFP